MSSNRFPLKSGRTVIVTVTEVDNNIGIGSHVEGETTVTCTCAETGKSTTKKCPKDTGNTCDCSDPNNPKVICG